MQSAIQTLIQFGDNVTYNHIVHVYVSDEIHLYQIIRP